MIEMMKKNPRFPLSVVFRETRILELEVSIQNPEESNLIRVMTESSTSIISNRSYSFELQRPT